MPSFEYLPGRDTFSSSDGEETSLIERIAEQNDLNAKKSSNS